MSVAMLALLLAAAPHGADAPDPEQLLDSDDYPQFALVHDFSAAAQVELYVSPQGRVMECDADGKQGDPQLADDMCEILRYKHLPPAHLADGTPAYSVVRGLARLFIPGTPGGDAIMRLSAQPDVALVSTRPVAQGEVALLLAVTPAGTVADCAAGKGERQDDLVRQVCPALRDLSPGQRVGLDGAGVPYVLTLRARVSQKDAAP